MTLYLKYRPKNLDELDLPEVGQSLKKIISGGSLPHAFLFAGPKGTGKTSAARILAKIINCENLGKDGVPCDKCEQCLSISKGNNLDVVEMDAASHRGIDDIRVLKDAVKLAPVKAKKKIYIIDEAHMLTVEASNALLKTLEEPPEHVVFILATTNPEKLIETVRSRTTPITFRKATTTEIVRSLKRVAEAEKIKITDELLEKIASIADGAFRDAIKMLEQYSLEGEGYLATFSVSQLDAFMQSLIDRNEKAAIDEIEKNINQGISAETYLKNILEVFHRALLSEVGIGESKIKGLGKDDLIILTDLFTEASRNLANSPVEELPLEIAVIKWCGFGSTKNKSNEPQEKKEESENEESKGSKLEAPQEEPQVLEEKIQVVPISETAVPVDQTTDIEVREMMSVDDSIWKNILLAIRPINASIEGLLRASKPVGYDGKTLTLGVFYKFHKERLEDGRHRKIVEDVVAKILNSPTRVVCTLVEPPPRKIIEEAKHEPVLTESKDKDIIKAAEEIFGS